MLALQKFKGFKYADTWSYFLNIPKNILSFELSSGGFSVYCADNASVEAVAVEPACEAS